MNEHLPEKEEKIKVVLLKLLKKMKISIIIITMILTTKLLAVVLNNHSGNSICILV